MENNNDPPKSSDKELDKEEDNTLMNNHVNENTHIPDPDIKPEINKRKRTENRFNNLFLFVCITGVTLGILLEIVNVMKRTEVHTDKPKYWVYPETLSNKTGILKHLHIVLERMGYELSTNETPWTLLWSYKWPFLDHNLRNLTPGQKVNHIPGSNIITSKVDLSTTQAPYIPKSFRLPRDKNKFLEYANKNKKAMFLQKKITHKGIVLKNVTDIDLDSGEIFVQEYLQNPFLVDGHKFDIGIYVVITSVNPLRVYAYKGDVLFRYCSKKYHPLDANDTSKYVVTLNYLPTWQIPSLAHSFSALGNTMKESFDSYVRSKGLEPAGIYEQAQNIIMDIFIKKEEYIIKMLKDYKSMDNFFELMRFDFLVDEDLKVYLLEANLSPNLLANHLLPNQLLYEQVLYNALTISGVSRAAVFEKRHNDKKAAQTMMAAEKNIAVFIEECKTTCKERCEASVLCSLCKTCRDDNLTKNFLNAYIEFLHRGDFRRILPPSTAPNKDLQSLEEAFSDLSRNNRLLHLWYQGKCNQDVTWCT